MNGQLIGDFNAIQEGLASGALDPCDVFEYVEYQEKVTLTFTQNIVSVRTFPS